MPVDFSNFKSCNATQQQNLHLEIISAAWVCSGGPDFSIFHCGQWRALPSVMETGQNLALRCMSWNSFSNIYFYLRLNYLGLLLNFLRITGFLWGFITIRYVRNYFTGGTKGIYVRQYQCISHMCISMTALQYSGYFYDHKKGGEHLCAGNAIYPSALKIFWYFSIFSACCYRLQVNYNSWRPDSAVLTLQSGMVFSSICDELSTSQTRR